MITLGSATGRIRNRSGFSLVELLVTLIVLTMIMGTTVMFFQSQGKAFGNAGEKMDLLQNARYTVTQVERLLRTLGAGVTGQQPMLVYGASNVVAFNTDFDEADTTDYRWAVNFNPSIATTEAVAWTVGTAGVIPNSSPGYTYPTQNYAQGNGAVSLAETKIFWFAQDSTTTRTDDYILWERTNNATPEFIARNILAYPGRPFLEFMLARRLNTGADTMLIASGSLLPLKRLWPQAGWTPTDTANAVRPDSVRAIRINIRVTNGKTGTDERTRDFSPMIQVPNNGLPSPNVCGRSPFAPTAFTAYSDTAPGSGVVYFRWTRSPDHGGGEFDVRQYVLWRRDDTATVWSDPLILVKADTTVTYDSVAVGGQVSGNAYDYAIAAQDCTPAVSTMLMVNGHLAP
ncbi:MAG: prepilin-type N-terminal cleavage/methylation domain-containing protein [Gemmatimonadetes bacterium]|nr:prepilin-type N-terminal cleavage/methylation domain-containing protein [Gemmatimonadota bacterium]